MEKVDFDTISQQLNRIEQALDQILSERAVKDWYSTAEVAVELGKAEFTVREWCRLARINAEKRACGRGNSLEWIVSHAELVRIKSHGLLPVPTYRHPK